MERFGRYVLLERIACGGMAEVFRAASLGTAGFSKIVAIKRILPHLAAEPACISMLIDEANIASTLSHPNILQVQDLGKEKNTFFIAMEFVAGAALNTVVVAAIRKSMRLPLEFCFHTVGQALHGLAYAHSKTDSNGSPMHIIHRDVSPQNIMVAYDGSIKLADFGIARAADRATHTQTGTLKGKAAYMSPEQVEGKPIDQRVDIYAMGVVLHELIAMKRLRRAESDAQILFRVAKGEFPKFQDMGVECPDDAAEVVYKALSVNPDDRWPDAASFGAAIDDVARKHGWHWNAARVAGLMKQLFPEEIAKEKQAQAYYQSQMSQLAAGGNLDAAETAENAIELPDNGTLDKLPRADPTRSRTRIPAPAPKPSWRLPVVVGTLTGVALAGAVVTWVLLAPSHSAPSTSAATSSLATLVVETQPPGASILVGGRMLDGVSPLVATELAAGPVEVEARLDGHASAKKVVTVSAGKAQKVKLELVATAVEIPVASQPAGATVIMDGRVVGTTPTRIKIDGKGAHLLHVELKGFAAVEQELLAERAPASLNFVLADQRPTPSTPTPAASPTPIKSKEKEKDRDRDKPRKTDRPSKMVDNEDGDDDGNDVAGNGKLSLQSIPWAKIYIDGKDTGRYTPAAEMSIPAGKHTVKLVNDDEGLSATFTVTIKAGALTSMSKELQ